MQRHVLGVLAASIAGNLQLQDESNQPNQLRENPRQLLPSKTFLRSLQCQDWCLGTSVKATSRQGPSWRFSRSHVVRRDRTQPVQSADWQCQLSHSLPTYRPAAIVVALNYGEDRKKVSETLLRLWLYQHGSEFQFQHLKGTIPHIRPAPGEALIPANHSTRRLCESNRMGSQIRIP